MGTGRCARTDPGHPQQLARGHALTGDASYGGEAGWRATPLAPDVQVVVTDRSEPAPSVTPLVDEIWAAARLERPALFDGRVFVADHIASDRIGGHWTSYRFLYARLRHPERFDPPPLRALAVNGLIRCRDGFVLGRREADAIYRPCCWQAIPAGSVEARSGSDNVDLHAQVLAELEEEVGLVADEVDDVHPVLAMEHPNGSVVDVGLMLATSLDFAAVLERWARRGNREYDRLRLVAPAEVRGLLRHAAPDLLVSARMLLECRPTFDQASSP